MSQTTFQSHFKTFKESRSILGPIIKSMRPKQWTKNVLVLAAPLSAGVLSERKEFFYSLVAVIAFSILSSATYVVNDLMDLSNDRVHPKKSKRPIASGQVSTSVAIVVAITLICVSSVLGAVVLGVKFLIILELYLLINVCYSIGLKKTAVIEMAAVASGFVLRAIAGGIATNVPLSIWFLLVASFGALLIVSGKRSAELKDLGEGAISHREVLQNYTVEFLRTTRLLAASVMVTAYCIWAFERGEALSLSKAGHDPVWYQLSIVPFVLAILVVELAMESGKGAAPEDLVFTDHKLQILGVVWIVLFVLGVYAWPL